VNEARQRLVKRLTEAIQGANAPEEVFRIAVEHISDFSAGYDWTGIYMLRGGVLEVGPYVGKPTPHTRIELSRGICGAAASQKQTIIVDDVNADPRFLACSVGTKSEIVVPLLDGDVCLGEIDIDSDHPAFFTVEDREMLEAIAALIVKRFKALK
jgi:GAF domain-containing protein